MSETRIDQQLHGYRSGHQLLSGSVRLGREDQDTVDRLSDLSGPLGPGEVFGPYLSTYPLPSGSYYVVARTWQDLEAPRAGCVLTRSLLMPMEAWERFGFVASLSQLLTPVEPNEKATAVQVPETAATLSPVDDLRTIELAEALFLENRQPIVVFEGTQAETMALRILTALWPGLRRNFAVCTFALGPRKIDKRDFDLVFAPKSARSRFSDWQGRRIEASSSGKPRHRWSSATAERIFKSPRPSLTAQDALGILRGDSKGDESALRLSLLWNELSEKAPTTPTAVLGLLDILNSQREIGQDRFTQLAPYVESALERATSTFSKVEPWHFLRALMGKFPEENPPERIGWKVEQTARLLAQRDPGSALEFLASESFASRTVPPRLLVGLSDGLSGTVNLLGDQFRQLSSYVVVQMMALSALLAQAVARAAKHDATAWLPFLDLAVQKSDRDARRKIRVHITPELDHADLASLLDPLLEGATGSELTDIALSIGRNTSFDIVEFDEPLGNAARDESSLHALRAAVISNFDKPGADRFILSTVRVESADIIWLCTEVPAPRACRLLSRLLAAAADRAVIAAQRDNIAREKMFEILSSDLSIGAPQAARVLALSDVSADELLRIGEGLLPHLADAERDNLSDLLLSRALSDAAIGDPRVASLVEAAQGRPAVRELIRWATPDGAAQRRIGENVVILEASSTHVRESIAARVDELSDRLVHLVPANLGQQAYEAWARLIADAPYDDVRFRGASPALSFALRHPNLPVSALIVASFPMVYAELLRSKEGDDRSIPAFIALPLSFFVDWDRAKSARRELVDAYLDSIWPPADLLLIAMEAGIAHETLDRLAHSTRGRNYIDAISKDLSRLSEGARQRAYASLRQF